jgi:hypothetical protein
VDGDVPVDSEALLVTDFVNHKIKPAQSFRCAHRGRVCVRVCVHRDECSYVYEYLCLYCVSKKRALNPSCEVWQEIILGYTYSGETTETTEIKQILLRCTGILRNISTNWYSVRRSRGYIMMQNHQAKQIYVFYVVDYLLSLSERKHKL